MSRGPSTLLRSRTVKVYLRVLACVCALAFLAGAAVNYRYAITHPGADPYAPVAKVAP